MKKRALAIFTLALMSAVMLVSCKKKPKEPELPAEQTIQALTVDQLQPGKYYVKSGSSFFLLPLEYTNFKIPEERPVKSKDGKDSGIIAADKERYAQFIYSDTAIPTLYKNDQLVYVADGDMPTFTWERYTELGYSIGIYGLELESSGKISASTNATFIQDSSVLMAIAQTENFPAGSKVVFDSANGMKLGSANYGEGGIITGMSKDSLANLDLYVGTDHFPISASVDTRYFKSFEVIHTEQYTLSADGYAIVDVPAYIKSGFYMLNNAGMVKYLAVDRGVDESVVDINTPYFYEQDGRILTFYEWQEANGIISEEQQQQQQATDKFDVNNFNDRIMLDIDQTQEILTIDLDYRYMNENGYVIAKNTGQFPKAYVVDPKNQVHVMQTQGNVKDDSNNEYTRMEATINNPLAGPWYLVYENLDNTYRVISQHVVSGNTNTYMHSGERGNITMWFAASDAPTNLVITWDNTDRALKNIVIRTPGGEEYSKEKTPDAMVADEMGRFIMRLPSLAEGNYKIELTGDKLGRVWVHTETVEAEPAPEGETVPEGGETAENAVAEGETTEGETAPEG